MTGRAAVRTLDLSGDEAATVRRCAAAFEPGSPLDAILGHAGVHAAELPRRLRRFVEDFRLTEPAGALLVRGLPVEEALVGPTPLAVDRVPDGTVIEDRVLVLLSTLLGDVFGWAAEYRGRVVHDLVPLPGHETDLSGTSSDAVLGWHTDEAYHPMRADYLVLLCIRNPDDVPTRVSVPDLAGLSRRARELLVTTPFPIVAESNHAADGADGTPVHLLFGDHDDPYVVFDPGYTDLSGVDDPAREAFAELERACDHGLTATVVLRPGDAMIVDNLRCVHGRGSFRARFDGTDRWLKRAYATRDLRRSRSARRDPSSRVVH